MADLLSYALTTVSDVKESLGISSGDSSQNNLIIRKINAATEAIEKYTGKRFLQTTYTNEEYDATNTDQLILKHNPIITFTRLDVRDSTLNESSWEEVDSELYFVDPGAGVLDLVFHATGKWNRYRATYTAGYATIPSDIQEACSVLASFMVQNPVTGSAIKSKEEGSRRIEYYDTQGKSDNIFEQLGIASILNAYCDYPLLADK